MKYLVNYDDVIATDLKNIENNCCEMEEKMKGSKKGDKIYHFGKGSILRFLSNDVKTWTIKLA